MSSERVVGPEDSEQRLRSFVALPLSDVFVAELTRVIAVLRDQPAGRRVAWVRPANLHLTLRFLGDVDLQTIAALQPRLAEVIAGVAAFELGLRDLHLFPSARRARVVAAGVEGGASLEELARAVEGAVVACGLPPEARSFRPHLTLGRIRESGSVPRRLDCRLEPLVMPVSRVVLYRSVLGSGGARHSELASFALAAG